MKITIYIAGITICMFVCSCKKYLDTKPSTAYSTISTVADAEQVLNFPENLVSSSLPNYGEYSADNYYVNTNDYDANFKNNNLGNVYTWGRYPFLNNSSGGEWASAYAGILICNTVLDALNRIAVSDAEKQAADNAKGIALVYRGYIFWKLAVIYAKAYDSSTANTDLGIPLRLGTQLDEKLSRGNVQQTYDQIIKDLTAAIPLLPSLQTNITKPSKASVNAMLAEVFLSMRNYEQAGKFADASLQLKKDLINYSALDGNSAAPIPVMKDNVEILAWCAANADALSLYMRYIGNIDTVLYRSYDDKDLRKRYFFTKRANETYQFSGNYSGIGGLFSGPTTAEMYLTRAECLARQGKSADAMDDLNTLLKNRILNTSADPFVPYVAVNSTGALKLILQERRKELLFRDLRWMDIKRLNLESFNITLKRDVDGQLYTLAPNDNRFALQLPESVIQISGMQQNPY